MNEDWLAVLVGLFLVGLVSLGLLTNLGLALSGARERLGAACRTPTFLSPLR